MDTICYLEYRVVLHLEFYFKYLLHAHALLNEDSDYIINDHHFKYKGNTKITKRQRGRVRDALSALQVM